MECNQKELLSALWKGPFGYQTAVMSCFSMTKFLFTRQSLWLQLGTSQNFWRMLYSYSRDVIGCMKPVQEITCAQEKRKQLEMRNTIIALNHERYRNRLEIVNPGTHYFLSLLTLEEG